MTFLLAFVIFWNPVPATGYHLYRDGVAIASVQDTCYQDSPGYGTWTYTVTAYNAAGESGHSAPVVTGISIDAARDGDVTFTGTLAHAADGRSITLITLPAPEQAWIVGGGVYVCRADYNFDGAVLLPDLAAFGLYWSIGSYQADLNGDGRIDLSDYAAFGNLYQWRRP